MIDDVVTFLVELTGQRFFCNRHTDGIGDALSQRAGGGFHARRIAVFRMPRGFGMQLTEGFQILDGQIIAGQMQQGINQHGAVTVGKNKTIAVGPVRISRVVRHEIIPQHFGDIRHTHGCARVAGIGLLYSIHTQCAYGISELFTR